MRMLSKPLPESTGKLSASPVFGEGGVLDAHRAPALARLTALPAPTISRRSVVATLIATFAPAAGTAVVLPKVVQTAAAAALQSPAAPPVLVDTGLAEDPELLAIGAELEMKLAAYRVAASRLAEARATAVKLWPAVPDEIVAASAEDRRRFRGYTYEEVDHNGDEVWPPSFWRDGKEYSPGPKRILLSGPMLDLLAEVRAEPEAYADWVEADLVKRIEAADRYEDARFEALGASGIEEAKQEAELIAGQLYNLMFEVKEHPPRTLGGVLIFARAMAAFEEAKPESRFKGEWIGGTVLGRGLADAVLRVAGITT